MSTRRLDAIAPPPSPPPDVVCCAELSTGIPSMTNNGCPSPCSVLMPRIVIDVLAPGSPEPETTVTPAAFDESAFTRLRSDDFAMSTASTVVVTVPSTSRVDDVPDPVTTTSPSRSGFATSVKSCDTVPDEIVTDAVLGRYPSARALSCAVWPSTRPLATTNV